MMGGWATLGPQHGILATEFCVPVLLLCWLCCWPDENSSDTSSNGKHPKKPVISHVAAGSYRRGSEFFGRRATAGSSVVSLHLPSTSGHSKHSLLAHRSHEEIPRKCQLQATEEPRDHYHSAPSVIDEVLHRRDWERSSRELTEVRDGDANYVFVPLKHRGSDDSLTPEDSTVPPLAVPESSSLEDALDSTPRTRTCKKHHTNTKNGNRSRRKESLRSEESKEEDATEATNISSFYIGDGSDDIHVNIKDYSNAEVAYAESPIRKVDESKKSLYKAKDAKQYFNESVRSKKSLGRVEEHKEARRFQLQVEDDRSGAEHHTDQSRSSLRTSLSRLMNFPPPSVEPVGYEGGACYLVESGSLQPRADGAGGGEAWRGAGRGRHASDGDILATAPRPESGAFSESDLDLDLELLAERGDHPPPAYCDLLHHPAGAGTRETAI